MQFETSIIRQKELNKDERLSLLNLHQKYYDLVKPSIFFRDLEEKEWIILMKNQQGEPLGFSTIQLIWLKIKKINHLFLFSGDTLVKEEIRNAPALAGAFIHFMYALIKAYPSNPLHWFLITKGYRTYRFLPVYFKDYFPVYDKPFPPDSKEILDRIAHYKFGDDYDPDRIIIRHKQEADRLKPEFAHIPEGKLKDRNIRFFYEKNPLFYLGDELACITDIRISNFNPLVERIGKHAKINFNASKYLKFR